MNVVVVDLESKMAHIRQVDLVQPAVFQIDDRLAGHAHQVVVLFRHGVETRRRAGMAYSGDDTQTHARIQNAVDRRARDSGNPVLDPVTDLVRGRMIVPGQDRLEYGATLDREQKSVLAAHPRELLDPFLFPRVRHVRTDGTLCQTIHAVKRKLRNLRLLYLNMGTFEPGTAGCDAHTMGRVGCLEPFGTLF